MTVVCFHNPSEENGYLSNWYPCRFTVDGVDFSSMEQYMMYKKAVYFGDKAVAAQILATDDVAEIKALGRLVAHYSVIGTVFGKSLFLQGCLPNSPKMTT